jgi:hypothetical protein
MPRFRLQDLSILEVSPTSPGTLRQKLGELLVHSVNAAARVELVDRQTGEYRVVLQGILDQEETGPDR